MIVGIGCLAYDNVLVTETPWLSGKGRIVRRETRIGGNARTALATAAALGHPAAYLATMGTSPTSVLAIADLIAHGVETQFIDRVEGADPVTATLTVTSEGERYIAFDDSNLATTPLPNPNVIDAAFDAAELLIVDATTAPPGSLNLIERARSKQIPVVLDAERVDVPDLAKMIDVADHIIVPLAFGRAFTGHANPTDVCNALWRAARSAVVLTDGPGGAYAAGSSDSVTHIPAIDVEVVDTTGCGDVFHGAYSVALLENEDVVSCVRFASAAAAVVASRPLDQQRVPESSELQRLLRRI